jgi:hypothetical protein
LENRLPPASALEIARVCSQTILTGDPHALHGWPLDSTEPNGPQHVTDWEIRRIVRWNGQWVSGDRARCSRNSRHRPSAKGRAKSTDFPISIANRSTKL